MKSEIEMKRASLTLAVCILLILGFFQALIRNEASAQATGATISISPTTNIADIGQYFTMSINVAGVEETKPLNFWEIKLQYSPDVLYTNETLLKEGSFLYEAAIGGGYSTSFNKFMAAYYVQLGCMITGPVGASGSGTLATITFLVQKKGTSDLSLFDTKLYDPTYPSSGSAITHTTADATFYARALLPKIYVNPAVIEVAVGQFFSVNIDIANVSDLYSYDIVLSWDPTVLNVTSVTEGSFLSRYPRAYDTYFAKRINNTEGWLYVACTILGYVPVAAASGSGTLANIVFQVKAVGETLIDLRETFTFGTIRAETKLRSIDLTQIPYILEDGYFDNIALAGRPIAVFTYSPFKAVVDEMVTFDASDSYDLEGTIISYHWNFGDGEEVVSTDPIVNHAYAKSGTYTIILTVTDNDGLEGTATKFITVQKIPSTITLSVSPTTITLGENLTISGDLTPVRAAVNVTIFYRTVLEWTTLAKVTTDTNGQYEYVWTPSTRGYYYLKSSWEGDERTLGDESDIMYVFVRPRPPTITIDPKSGPVGTKVTVKGLYFEPGMQMYLLFDDQLIGLPIAGRDGSLNVTFNVPLSQVGPHAVKVLTISYYLYELITVQATFTVVDVTPLDIRVEVGTVYFKGETAEFYVQTALRGAAVNASSISAKLYKPDATIETLTAQLMETGLYRIRFTINGRGSMHGTYALVVEANYTSETITSYGTTIKTFLVKPTWEREAPKIAAFSIASIGLVSAMILLYRREKKKFL